MQDHQTTEPSPAAAPARSGDTILQVAAATAPVDDAELGMVLDEDYEQAAADLRPTPFLPTGRPHAAAPLDFGAYELLGELGRGGMGVVYKARQKGLDRLVAVKMILSNHLANVEQVERFYAEARAASRIVDPNIVAIHDVGEFHGQHYFAMEYVAGQSLSQRLQDGPMPAATAARLVMIVARAIGRLHAIGVVHRDLKPSNILLDDLGQPCVTDFGLAKMLSADGPATRTGAIVGTPSYMAPEQAAGQSELVGPLSDVYSLGAILYELLTGRPPFDEDNPLDTLVQVLEAEPDPPGRVRPGVPKPLELICLKCLERPPAARYESAEALADDLDRFLRDEPVEARRIGLLHRLGRWTRREPALVSRLSTLVICGTILYVDQLTAQTLDRSLNRRILIVLMLGVGASVIFQALLRSARWSSLARYTWATADLILFTSIVQFSEALSSSVVAGYFLLITASGLWFRERLVWYTTALAVVSYASQVALEIALRRGNVPSLQNHLLFMVGLVVAGLIVSYQVKRVRALSLYYEHRPLP